MYNLLLVSVPSRDDWKILIGAVPSEQLDVDSQKNEQIQNY